MITPKPPDNDESWLSFMHETIAKLELGAALNNSVVFNPKGCAALAECIKTMAEKLDMAIREGWQPPTV